MMRFIGALALVCVLELAQAEGGTAQDAARSSAPDTAAIQKVVSEICSDGGQWLKCYSLDPADCSSVTAAFVEPCVKKVYANALKDSAVHPVSQLLGCFNQEFMRKYGYGEVKTAECANPMKHLMKPK